MRRSKVKLDNRRRAVTWGGRTTVLQEKSWQVLSILIAGEREIVTRKHIIDTVWQGNYLTGEKGLNQAVWAIRTALNEDAQQARFIRTVPRVGYQWVRSASPAYPARSLLVAASVTAIAVISAVAGYASWQPAVESDSSAKSITDMVATRAFLVDRDIHVEFASGCLGILKNAGNFELGSPILSADGKEVAVTMRQPKGCSLVTIELPSGKRRDFGACPTI